MQKDNEWMSVGLQELTSVMVIGFPALFAFWTENIYFWASVREVWDLCKDP